MFFARRISSWISILKFVDEFHLLTHSWNRSKNSFIYHFLARRILSWISILKFLYAFHLLINSWNLSTNSFIYHMFFCRLHFCLAHCRPSDRLPSGLRVLDSLHRSEPTSGDRSKRPAMARRLVARLDHSRPDNGDVRRSPRHVPAWASKDQSLQQESDESRRKVHS